MSLAVTSRMTYSDLLDLPEDGKQYEIHEGELVLNPAPIPRHQLIVLNIAAEFHIYLRANGGGRVFMAPIDVLLAQDVVVQPDVIVVRTDRVRMVGERNIQGPPNLVVEVLSDATRRRDENIKRKLYERYGVDEYWIVDPVIEAVKIYRRIAEGFTRVAEISNETGGVIETPLLAGFTLDVSVVFGS